MRVWFYLQYYTGNALGILITGRLIGRGRLIRIGLYLSHNAFNLHSVRTKRIFCNRSVASLKICGVSFIIILDVGRSKGADHDKERTGRGIDEVMRIGLFFLG